jgi:glutathione synthase/RimK-type ligase-like ATP-grasp enzyme
MIRRAAILTFEHIEAFTGWSDADIAPFLVDDRLVREAFERRGVPADNVSWADPSIDWSRYDVALVRSTWDYIDRPDDFVDALEAIERAGCRVLNPPDTIRWNHDKRYLLELARSGVPVVPTWPADAVRPSELAGWMREHGHAEVILKPVVGAAANGVVRVPVDGLDGVLGARRAEGRLADHLVQPLIDAVTTEGELSFIYLDGALSHAIRKLPAAGDFRVQTAFGGTFERISAAADDIAHAEAIRARIPFDPLYMRLDVVRHDGRLAVMEVELIEPVLYLDQPEADRLVHATLARLS